MSYNHILTGVISFLESNSIVYMTDTTHHQLNACDIILWGVTCLGDGNLQLLNSIIISCHVLCKLVVTIMWCQLYIYIHWFFVRFVVVGILPLLTSHVIKSSCAWVCIELIFFSCETNFSQICKLELYLH